MEEYQELFNILSQEHGVTALQSEMDEILNACRRMDAKYYEYKDKQIKELEEEVKKLKKVTRPYRQIGGIR